MIDSELQRIQDYINSLEQRINVLVYEKNSLIKQVSRKTVEIRETKEELARWEKSFKNILNRISS